MAKIQKKTAGWIYLTCWALLIVAGIVAKRVFGLPDMMVFFHLPAAVFLVLAFYELSRDIRMQYQKEIKKFTPSQR